LCLDEAPTGYDDFERDDGWTRFLLHPGK
jgi:hypothetical protein